MNGKNPADPSGDARKTSVRALFPAMFKAIQNGSLAKWMMSSNKASDFPFDTVSGNKLYQYVKSKQWRSWSIDTGLGTVSELAYVLSERDNVQINPDDVVQ